MFSTLVRIPIALCALSFLGCVGFLDSVAVLQPGAERVRLVNQEPQGCAHLGDVYGKSTAERDPEAGLQGARNDLRNRAYALGATDVVIQNSSSDKAMGMWRPAQETVVAGVALKCPTAEPSGAVAAAPQASAAAAPAPPPPRCRASSLPQWKDAEPYQKKKLLEYCRAPADSPDPGMPKLD